MNMIAYVQIHKTKMGSFNIKTIKENNKEMK